MALFTKNEVQFAAAQALLPEDIRKNMTVVRREELPNKALYHISTNPKIPVFIPMVSNRVANKEDNRVPRVCTAPSIVECMGGYGAVYHDFYGDGKNEAQWTVYSFDFDYAIRPTKKLVPDAHVTNEHWLIAYSPETREYRADKLGTVRMTSFTTRWINGVNVLSLELVVAVTGDTPILFSDGVLLERGFHLVDVKNWYGCGQTLKDIVVETKSLSRAEYQQYVKEKVELEHAVPSAAW